MSEIDNVLRNTFDYIVLKNTTPYTDVEEFTGITENFVDSGVGTILKKEFRYSFDNDTFSEFTELNIQNLSPIKHQTIVYFDFRYILLSGGPIILKYVSLAYNKIVSDANTPPSRIQDENSVYAYPVIYKPNFTWQPYKMNRAIRLYKDLNLAINNLFGHDVSYYRVLPQGRSKDVILMEYSLYDHDEQQCMKVVVPNNEFPDNKLNMGPFGVDFELPFEVQVDKDYFQKIFGEGSGPQKRDVIFFPRTNRIYEVSSSYLFRDFMNEPLYFKITLIKWVPKANVEQSESMDQLESFTVSTTSLFGNEINQDEQKITNEKQFTQTTTFVDPVRNKIEVGQEIGDIKLLNYYTLIAEYFYKMGSLLQKNAIKIDTDSASFTKDDIYHVRYSPDTVQPDEQYLYSMKTLTYKGVDNDGKSIFEYNRGSSHIQSNYSISQIFNTTSEFKIFSNDYTGLTGDISLANCNTMVESYRKHVVEYKIENEFPSSSDRSYCAWFRLKENTSSITNVSSFVYDMYTRRITLNFSRPVYFLMNDTVSIKRSSTSSFLLFGNVVNIISSTSVEVEIDQEIINFVIVYFSNWQSFSDLQCQLSMSRVFINGLTNGKGFKIELFENRHFRITSNDSYKYFSFSNMSTGLDNDVWYAVFVNFSNIFKQLTVNVWKIQWDPNTNLPATTELSVMMNTTIEMENVDRSSCVKFFLEPSYMDLTNIRLFTRVVETDKQTFVLNQNIVKDSQWSLIIDNAIPELALPHVGYTH